MSTLLVVGAKEGSVGANVAAGALPHFDKVYTAGISGEDFPLDATSTGEAWGLFAKLRPTNVLCTVGINEPCVTAERTIFNAMVKHFQVNCAAVMNLLQCWMAHQDLTYPSDPEPISVPQFVAVSSNSARIPRTRSAPYCASKAALSMALQVAARESADKNLSIYGWEFGYIENTPMSKATERGFGVPHRIPGGRSLDVLEAADMILYGMTTAQGYYVNGNMLRVDGGEL